MKTTTLIIGVISIISFILDLMLRKKEKSKIQNFLENIWIILNERKFNNINQKMVKVTLNLFKSIFGDNFLTIKNILKVIIISFSLTTLSLITGRIIESFKVSNLNTIIKNTLIGIIPYKGVYVSQILFPINLVSDFVTIFVTILILKKLSKVMIYKKIILILFDILIAFTLSLFTMSVAKLLTYQIKYSHFDTWNNLKLSIYHSLDNFENLINLKLGIVDYDSMFFSLTTFLPTTVYLLIFIFLILIFTIDKFFNQIFIQILERFIDNVGTLIFSKISSFLLIVFGILTFLLS